MFPQPARGAPSAGTASTRSRRNELPRRSSRIPLKTGMKPVFVLYSGNPIALTILSSLRGRRQSFPIEPGIQTNDKNRKNGMPKLTAQFFAQSLRVRGADFCASFKLGRCRMKILPEETAKDGRARAILDQN